MYICVERDCSIGSKQAFEMKKRIQFILSVFLFFIVVFLLFKSIFTILHASIGGGISVSDFFAVLYNGLSMDMSTSGYLTALPALLTIVSIWVDALKIKKILRIYFIIITLLLTSIYIADIAIYPYWGYHFDSTIFLYLASPSESLASASTIELVLGVIGFVLVLVGLSVAVHKLLLQQIESFDKLRGIRIPTTLTVLILVTGALFLPIRGGFTVSTMNVGRAYFSENMFLNHAAVNPCFNLLYSATKSERFDKQYQFYDRTKAENIFAELTKHSSDSTVSLLKTDKPNIILFILESFSAEAAYDSLVAPNFVKLSKEGVNFSNFYANSFRTDRGLVSILSGYPAHPTAALMKYPQKTQSLPAIPKALVKEGYSSAYYYGGDNDFASMRSYIVGACATDKVFQDRDFPISTRLTKWGVPDEYVLERVYDDVVGGKYKEPFMTTVLTLSSHEPFDVPIKDLEDPYLNSVRYTDREIGKFVEKLKVTNLWDNTLLIFLADHCMQSFPQGVEGYSQERYHIPMVWSGGAVKEAREVEVYGSQNNLAATLLGQLGVDYSEFKFSSDMLNPDEPKFAFYSYNNGFSMIDSTGVVIYDNNAKKIMDRKGADLEEKAKSFFQMMYLDLGER